MRRIAICAPATPLKRKHAHAVEVLAKAEFPDVSLHFHPQCFEEEGHFAGPDARRLEALLECTNDAAFDAVWFAKGGYGSNRIAAEIVAGLDENGRRKTYLGYSDCGTLLGALYKAGAGLPVHAPMPIDIKRKGGEAAIRRVLAWLGGEDEGVEPSLSERPAAAFNLYTLAMLVGTDFMPSLAGHELLVEEVGEYEYAVDRLFFHVTQHLGDVAGIRLGEVTHVPENDRPFGVGIEDIARYWCEKSGIPYLGRAEIGHSAANRIVPFGLETRRPAA
ncbi:LD-carboxypeptidase [Erythrobacter litoralis]|uniref:LD-carboxypeptidase n=1 Tax=Erythrobacter litoralis TaxID=39960 RepID=UPI003D6EDDE9